MSDTEDTKPEELPPPPPPPEPAEIPPLAAAQEPLPQWYIWRQAYKAWVLVPTFDDKGKAIVDDKTGDHVLEYQRLTDTEHLVGGAQAKDFAAACEHMSSMWDKHPTSEKNPWARNPDGSWTFEGHALFPTRKEAAVVFDDGTDKPNTAA